MVEIRHVRKEVNRKIWVLQTDMTDVKDRVTKDSNADVGCAMRVR
jgi:hypothetical protein